MGLRCLFVAYMTASPRCSRAAHALTSGSCHCPTSPSDNLCTKSRVACILRSTWSFMLHIGPRSAPRRSAPRVMHTRLSRLLVLLIVALATVLCTSHRVSTLRATLRLQVRASLLALLHTIPVALATIPLHSLTSVMSVLVVSALTGYGSHPSIQLRLLHLSAHLHVHVHVHVHV